MTLASCSEAVVVKYLRSLAKKNGMNIEAEERDHGKGLTLAWNHHLLA